MNDVMLPLSEVFGPTWQGEGPHTGQRTGFVRLGLCNLSCEWCDTPYTWDSTRYDVHKECPDTAVSAIHERLRKADVDVVCLSGGEPLMHRAKLEHLLTPEWTWHVESNGTIAPPPYWDRLVAHTSVSPKINTRDPLKKRIKPLALQQWAAKARDGRAAFKFVARTPKDLDVIGELVSDLQLRRGDVWIMPEGTDSETLLLRHKALAPYIEGRGWNTTTRLHTLIYEQERGR